MPNPKVYIIHENAEWTEPLEKALDQLGTPYETWHLDEGLVDLRKEPPQGIFYNRMSASSHTRGHRYAPEFTGIVLDWLESYDRKVFNDSRALQLELSKVKQYSLLSNYDITVPKTIAAVGKKHLLEAAGKMEGPFITKHNRAGKGLGVQLFQTLDAFKLWLETNNDQGPVDGIWLVQAYIQSPEPFITRCEFVGGEFYYAVEVDTSEGFELCPADACQISDRFCPVGEIAPAKFRINDSFDDPVIKKYQAFLKDNGIAIAGIEFIRDSSGKIYTYDVNTNTNYNKDAEAHAGKSGMKEIASFLTHSLKQL